MAALATTAAFAQSSVTIDGAVDLGIVKPLGATGARLDATNGANQIRFLGTEDLGGGMKAHFTLAQRFSPESGRADGTANQRPTFQGESTVGLSGAFGSVKLGRALTALQGPVNATDPWGTLQAGSTAVLATRYTTDDDANRDGEGAGRTEAIHYTSPKFGGLTASVSYGLKTSTTIDTADSTASTTQKAKNLTSLWLSYAAGPLTVGGGVENNRADDKITAVLATYNMGVATVGAGYSTFDSASNTADRKSYNLMAVVPMGAITFKAGYGTSKLENAPASVKKTGLGIDYALSKRTKLYTSYGTDSVRTSNKSGYDFGVRHTF